jgi:hypothetical protein
MGMRNPSISSKRGMKLVTVGCYPPIITIGIKKGD